MPPEIGVEVSAPSKLILHGEHGVVYDKLAVAGSLDLRTRMTILRRSKRLVVDFPDIGVLKESWGPKDLEPLFEEESRIEDIIPKLLPDSRDPIQIASLKCFFYLYKRILGRFLGLYISVESDIPIGAGLGSSAALSVCLAAGLLTMNGHKNASDPEVISKYAFLSEKILHGSPSGIDNSVSAHGGLIAFKKGSLKQLVAPFDIRVLLVESGVSRNTKKILEGVRERLSSSPKVIESLLQGINEISEDFIELIKDLGEPLPEDFVALEDLIHRNHSLLRALGVSHPRLEEIISVSEGLNFRGGKLTGAGGGGFAFILIPPSAGPSRVQNLISALEDRGFERPRLSSIGVDGVRIKRIISSEEDE
uniref:Mevalonate kinase n=1 Tax=Caligus rogercresseyi TaxID=217165 RepID=C1BR41_CALRO|nr:Mevalonate kinase [Caligus rogercresseyi]